MDANGNYCFIFHYDAAPFAGLPLREFEAALEAEGIPLGVSYPSLGDLELFAGDDRPPVPVAVTRPARRSGLEHRMLLARRESVLDAARAVEKIQAGAAELVARSATV